LQLASCVLACDVISKTFAERILVPRGGRLELVPGRLALSLAGNRGVTGGLLRAMDTSILRPLLTVMLLSAAGFLVVAYGRVEPRLRVLRAGLALMLGGLLGNAWDRIRLGCVLDFIDVHAMWRGRDRSSTFNLADVAIVLGLCLVVYHRFWRAKRCAGA
jgi:signal peptidase II